MLAGIPNDNVIDTEGAKDWTTAAIICGIVRRGKSFAELNEEDLLPILMEAQRFASEKSPISEVKETSNNMLS